MDKHDIIHKTAMRTYITHCTVASEDQATATFNMCRKFREVWTCSS